MKRRIVIFFLLLLGLLAAISTGAAAEERYTARTSMARATDAQRANILLACEALDGMAVERGDSFSFNDALGPRTRGRGYVMAKNGRGVSVTGGGVGQAATTLYLALKQIRSGIEYDALSTYGQRFTGGYVSDGSLAVMTDYAAGTDFAFTNYASDMTVEMWVSGGALCCTLTLESDSAGGGGRALSARIPCGGDRNTLHNIRLAAESINDTALEEGDRFSFNGVVGPRTEKYGYVRGTNGRGAKVTGGGVAQVASALWLAIKNDDDFTVIEKYTYGKKYNQDYVDNASDAIVTDYQGGTDFSFRYTGEGAATIYTYVEGEYLRCEIKIDD